MILDRKAILSADDLKHEDIECPEWGGPVRVRVLTGTERDTFGASMVAADGTPDMSGYRLRLAAACIVGEDNVAIFSATDIAALGSKNGAVVERLFRAAERLNAMDANAVDAAAGNLPAAPSGASS